jgi:glycine dehydrogenase
MNLHKTFAIPHGGGGPGMGPIGLKAHLAPFMAGACRCNISAGPAARVGPGRRLGRALRLGLDPADLLDVHRHDGRRGPHPRHRGRHPQRQLRRDALEDHYPVLYTGKNGRVAHECILDIRAIKAATGIAEIDIAKRLMDYGFHAPTVSFPVAGTIMVEPTESESKAELDRFCAALISIREEIRKIENGAWPADDNPLKRAPHTQADSRRCRLDASLHAPASRVPAALGGGEQVLALVNRIDDVYGDRNLFCACVPIEEYENVRNLRILVLTVIGDDRPGLVGELAAVISAHHGNWLESSIGNPYLQRTDVGRRAVPCRRRTDRRTRPRRRRADRENWNASPTT